jgi:hypothetical protein
MKPMRSELDSLRAANKVMREALESMIGEANQHLGMYVKAYRRESYDTGIMLTAYCNDATERIKRAENALAQADKIERGE